MFLLSVSLVILLLFIAIIFGFPKNNHQILPKEPFFIFYENNPYPTSKNILDLVLSKIKTAKNDDLMLLSNIIQKYADNKINHADLYTSNIHFSKDCDCFDYFVKKMLNHQFKASTIYTIYQAIHDEINKRQ